MAICGYCKEEYEKKRINQKYCSKKCKWRTRYYKHQKEQIERSKRYLKRTNYACMKTPERRRTNFLKRRTREKYPLKDKLCKFCGDKSTEHHHYTNPIEVDKFYFVCHKCHVEIERELKKTRKNA